MQVECKKLEVISLKNKKILVGAAVAAALLINIPQVSADDVETFGGEFEENDSEVVPFQEENENLGSVLVFNHPDEIGSETPAINENPKVEETPEVIENTAVTENPIVKKTPEVQKTETENVVINPTPKNSKREKISAQNNYSKNTSLKGRRFIKVAKDDEYTYYLDKQTVSWKRLPYSASEYMLDCWVRMIENVPDTSDIPNYLSDYVSNGENGEIEVARERKVSLNQADIDVLKHKKFFLQHYYMRPKTKQIQFLCELEIVGHPQNTVSEREYDYKNWENLIPGSVESVIYQMTMKSVSKKGSSDKGRMSFADMMDEYLRISIR